MKTIFTLFCLLFAFTSYGQLLDLSTTYRSNWQIINPAATNELIMADKLKTSILNTSIRTQWLGEGVDGAPFNGNVRYENHPYTESSNTRIKWGILASGTTIGALNTLRVQGNIAAILPLNGDKETIAVGANFGSITNRIRMCTGTTLDKGSECVQFASGTLYPDLGESFSSTSVDLAVGVFYQKVLRELECVRCDLFIDEFYVGLSIPQITPFGLDFSSSVSDSIISIQPRTNISLLAGAFFPVFRNSKYSKQRKVVEASIWMRHLPNTSYIGPLLENDRIPLSADFNVRYLHDNIFWAGVGGSTQGMGHIEAGMYLKKQGMPNEQGMYISNISAAYSTPLAWDNPFRNFMEINIGFAWK